MTLSPTSAGRVAVKFSHGWQAVCAESRTTSI
jgi:hypothetical protein